MIQLFCCNKNGRATNSFGDIAETYQQMWDNNHYFMLNHIVQTDLTSKTTNRWREVYFFGFFSLYLLVSFFFG